jgi:type II secretory pathway pseudopilin PulG
MSRCNSRKTDALARAPGLEERQGGFALLLAVLLLLMLASIGFAALDTVQRDQQTAGYANRKRQALNAAEAAIARAQQTLRDTGTPSVPATTIGDTTMFPHGRPSFQTDPNEANPIQSIGLGGMPGMNLVIGEDGAATYQVQFWKIQVQGDAPGGTEARAEVVSGRLLAN